MVYDALGIDPAGNIKFSDRLQVQSAIFNIWSQQYKIALAGGQGFVFDRCPLDFAAYLLADCPRDLDGQTSMIVMEYIKQCIESSKELGIIFFVEPHGQQVEQRQLKASATNEAYASLVQHIINSMLLKNMSRFFRIGAGTVDTRLTQVGQCLSSDFAAKAQEEVEARRDQCPKQLSA